MMVKSKGIHRKMPETFCQDMAYKDILYFYHGLIRTEQYGLVGCFF